MLSNEVQSRWSNLPTPAELKARPRDPIHLSGGFHQLTPDTLSSFLRHIALSKRRVWQQNGTTAHGVEPGEVVVRADHHAVAVAPLQRQRQRQQRLDVAPRPDGTDHHPERLPPRLILPCGGRRCRHAEQITKGSGPHRDVEAAATTTTTTTTSGTALAAYETARCSPLFRNP